MQNLTLFRHRFLTSSVVLVFIVSLLSSFALRADLLPSEQDIPPLDIAAYLDDEHLAVFLLGDPDSDPDYSDPEASRAGFKAFTDTLPEPPEGVTIENIYVPGHDEHEIMLRIFRPDNLTTPAPVLYWMHGGGFFLGDATQDDGFNGDIALELGILVISVEYRLAPENPFPTPILDCYHGLLGMAQRSEELGIDLERIAIGGNSAGGGLAAALALGVRDLGGPTIRFQWLIYPSLDDRNQTYSSYAITDSRVWNRASNITAWDYYLNGLAGSDNTVSYSDDIMSYAAPARATDLSNLPAAYISIGTLDLFLDENITYAQRLLQAGVPTELRTYPGAFHASNIFVPDSEISKRWKEDERDALRRALKN